MKKQKKFESAFSWEDRINSYLIVGISSFLYFIGLARINPDPHHDGVQFAAAAGVADGLKIHSQIYEQYGPVTAWIQGVTLKIFGSTLLNLRLENVVVLTIATLLLLRILFILRVPNRAAILICVLWAISCPASSIYPGESGFWPWSSNFALVFLLANAGVLIQAQVQRRSLTSTQLYLAAATCAAVVFTRFQVGIAASAINLLLIFLGFGGKSKDTRSVRTGKFLLALILSNGFFIFILLSQGSMTGFIDQIIVGPLHEYVYPFDWYFFRIHYFLASAPILFALLLATICWRRMRSPYRAFALTTIALSLGVLIYLATWRSVAVLNQPNGMRAALDMQGISILFTSVVIFLILAFLAICYFLSKDFFYPLLVHTGTSGKTIRSIYRSFGGRIPRKILTYSQAHRVRRQQLAVLGTLLLLLLPFLIQLYPLSDKYHLWWVAPLFMALIPYTLGNFVSRKGVSAITASIVVPALISCTFMYLNLLKVPRSELTEGALKGMQIESQYYFSYMGVNNMLHNVEPNSARFYCRDGLLASWTGSYLSVDAAYVSWAWVAKNPPTLTVPSRIFFCGTQESADSFAAANNFTIVGQGAPYRLSYWSAGTLFELTR
jgi:hypothetical protein